MNLAEARARNYAPAPIDARESVGGGRRVETPYTRARRERDALLGTSLLHARAWRAAATVVSALLGISLLGNLYLGTRSRVVPHVIEVDSLGAPTYRGPAGGALTPSQAAVRYHLAHFIDLTRTVTTDAVLYRRRLLDARKMLTLAGNALYNEWGDATKPMELAKTKTTAVEIASAVPLSKDTWQIDWQERAWDLSGNSLGKPVLWRAMLKVIQREPSSAQQLVDNPLGIYIDEFHWDRQLPVN